MANFASVSEVLIPRSLLRGRSFFRKERKINTQTFLDLDLTVNQIRAYLEVVTIADYSKGPWEEKFYGEDMWVFGINIDGKEIYIKVTMGKPGNQVFCISFHIAQHPMPHPFR